MASILVSEADPDVRRLLVLVIERLGHEAIVLDRDGAIPPRADLLLLEPSSAACIDQARRARERSPELPIVAMSALPPEAAFVRRGPLEYLEKPFTIDELVAALDR
jgi:DNA-binding response OmpR family regulator